MKDPVSILKLLLIVLSASLLGLLIYFAYERKWFAFLFQTTRRKSDEGLREPLAATARSAYESAQRLQEVQRRLQFMEERVAVLERQMAGGQRAAPSYAPITMNQAPSGYPVPRAGSSATPVVPQACGLSEAQSFFEEWCRTNSQPESSSRGWEVSAMVFSRERLNSQGKVVGYELRDSTQSVGHFFRVGVQGQSTAFLFPHPLSTYSPHIQAIFPGVTKAGFVAASSLLGTVPQTITRSTTEPQTWECPCPS